MEFSDFEISWQEWVAVAGHRLLITALYPSTTAVHKKIVFTYQFDETFTEIFFYIYSVKATESIPKVKVIKTVGKKSGKRLYIVISNYWFKGGDTVVMQLPSSWYKNESEVYKN